MKNRQRLLLAAVDLFRDQGYAATSVEDLLAETSVARSNFYYHFDGKEGLARELVLRWASSRTSALEEAAIDDAAPDERIRRIRAVLRDHEAAPGDGPVVASVALQVAPHDDRVRESLRSLLDRVERLLAVATEGDGPPGENGTGPTARQLGRAGSMLLVGALEMERVFPDADGRDAAVEALLGPATRTGSGTEGRLAAAAGAI